MNRQIHYFLEVYQGIHLFRNPIPVNAWIHVNVIQYFRFAAVLTATRTRLQLIPFVHKKKLHLFI